LLGCGRGSDPVVVIEGGPGFGKTRLLREHVRRPRSISAFAAATAWPIHSIASSSSAPLLEARSRTIALFDPRLLSDQHAAPGQQRFWLLQDIEALLERAA